jgi:DNA polymerase-3 subunit gamma/tau
VAYLGLARKWRPQTFNDLVGQSHIAQTIINAIKTGRVSQGYLFTGTRGIGKTSTARIFAKALRCQATSDPGIPCNKCGDCLEIAEGRSVDVLEIDGASNNGVDAVREIRENAKYLPSNGKYKIYIIDEVHMLTTAAFNALLKTLEEPPSHVLFVFATTDPQKIPATVLSRCQRFDFKRVSQKDLTGRLKEICTAENVAITDDALAILGREAEGSMRDAVSLLDQVLAMGVSSGGKINATIVTNSLGLIDKQTVLDCITGILKREPLKALEAVGKVYLHGFDLKQFGREILRYLRQILVVSLLEQAQKTDTSAQVAAHMDISDVDIADLRALTKERSIEDLDMLFRLLNHGLEDVARSTIPKMVMDVLIVKMAAADELINISDLSAPPTTEHFQARPVSQAAAPKPASQFQAPKAAPAVKQAEVPSPKTQATPVSQAVPPQGASSKPMQTGAFSWPSAVEFIKSQKPLVGSVLEHLSFESITQDGATRVICLGYSKDRSFYKDQLQSRAYTDLISQLLKNYLGSAVRLDYKEVLANKSLEALAEQQRRQNVDEKKRAILESEALMAAQQLLGARLEKLDL